MLIKEIPIEERPRERLIKYGCSSLSNEDLLSIIIKNGTSGKSAKDISLEILKKVKKINNLKNININDLSNIKGLGKIKKIELLAVIELGRRVFLESDSSNKIRYTSPKIIYENSKHLFVGMKQELFYCLYLDNKKHLIDRKLLFMGTVDKSIVHPREIFKYAYIYSASSIICLHNHPTGDVNPSNADIELTNMLYRISLIQGIQLVDHIIIGENNYYSFYDNNLLKYEV